MLSQIWLNFAEIVTRGSTVADKNTVWKFLWRIQVFMEKRRTKSLHFWPNFDPLPPSPAPPFLWRWLKSKTISCINENLQPLGYPNMSKPRLISSHLSRKNTITLCTIWTIFGKKQGGVTNQTIKIIIWLVLFHPNDSWSTSCKKFWFHHIRHKGHFRKILTQIFKFGFFYWYHAYVFEKNCKIFWYGT